MARQRRGGGFRPPELRGTLGTLLRTTLAQAGTLRDVLERGAREGRSRLDSALSTRRRTDALADLGDIVLDLIRRGEIDLDELPEARDIVAHLDEIDAGGHGDEHDEQRPAAPARNRFDTRRRDTPNARGARDNDGTVSSKSQSFPRPRSASASASAKPAPAPRVWRPPVERDEPESSEPERPDDEITARERPPASASTSASGQRRASETTLPGRTRKTASNTDDQPTTPSRPGQRKDPARKGGIHFDDDDDLAEYMHPDDVPPKGTPDGEA